MAVVTNPFEGSFENLTTNAIQGTKKAVKTVASDVKMQLTGQEEKKPVENVGFTEQLGLKPASKKDKKEEDKKKTDQLAQTRQNLQKINEEIEQARKARLKREEEAKKIEAQKSQEKKAEEKKKKEDPIWKKMLKGQMGSREGGKHVSG